MRLSIRIVVLAAVGSAMFVPVRAKQLLQSGAPCDVTVPNGIVAGSAERQEWSYGNAALSVGPFGLWPNGTVIFKPGGAGVVMRDGSLAMKFGWTRGVRGRLTVSGHRLDGDAPPLRSQIPCCYGESGETGFQASQLIFSTPGCWEVSAQVGDREDSKLTFVTKVVKIGDGPARPDLPDK
jgi:hypothetical protein